MTYNIKIRTPYNTYYLDNYTKNDVIQFKDSLETYMGSDYSMFSFFVNNNEVLLPLELMHQSEILIYKTK